MTGSILEIVSHNPQQTQHIGRWLGEHLADGSVVLLSGNLGAGKTCLTQGVAQGIGIQDYVTSPTFTLINEYRNGRVPLYHIDLYRIRNEAEAAGLGLDDYLYDSGVCVIEWPEQAPEILPRDHLHITISHTDQPEQRHLRLEAVGTPYADILINMKLDLEVEAQKQDIYLT